MSGVDFTDCLRQELHDSETTSQGSGTSASSPAALDAAPLGLAMYAVLWLLSPLQTPRRCGTVGPCGCRKLGRGRSPAAMRADAESSCTASCTASWLRWLGSPCGQAAPRTSRSSCCATNSLCCAGKSTDPSSLTPTAACSERSRPCSRDRAEPGGWSPPTRCCVSSGAASSGTGPNHSDRRADHRPQQSFADSDCASQPTIRPGLPPHPRRTERARPPDRCVHGLADPQQRRNRPRTHTLQSHLIVVPAVAGRRRLRLRHRRHRHAA